MDRTSKDSMDEEAPLRLRSRIQQYARCWMDGFFDFKAEGYTTMLHVATPEGDEVIQKLRQGPSRSSIWLPETLPADMVLERTISKYRTTEVHIHGGSSETGLWMKLKKELQERFVERVGQGCLDSSDDKKPPSRASKDDGQTRTHVRGYGDVAESEESEQDFIHDFSSGGK
ncbi:hypothetical protein K505DRAFT_336130 [Melanomma pulvis-pyrius CBS 109.77]|uniref:Uncharacterized protein n=1 Tax=Melanomma pulvis-pyrius CBS 109.77 TaxID=1314802 RepID=A0A6A6XGE8_9PLEO|nr:hypothetical protein K505DRAFT_336130 [Melanomma pulvis-pyrius CBS 109.77]